MRHILGALLLAACSESLPVPESDPVVLTKCWDSGIVELGAWPGLTVETWECEPGGGCTSIDAVWDDTIADYLVACTPGWNLVIYVVADASR